MASTMFSLAFSEVASAVATATATTTAKAKATATAALPSKALHGYRTCKV